MSNQLGDCFKFLWPFQNVRTLRITNRVVNTHKINYLVTCRLNLTLEDLEADEVEDENWQQGLSAAGKSDTKVTASGKKTRVIPRRRVAEKKATFSDESE